jgi:hypothetical protein
VKDSETLYESVEWVVSVGEEKSPIINEISDGAFEAYSLFASFTHNPASQTADGLATHFVLLDSHDDFNMPKIRSEISTALTKAKQYTDNAKTELNKSISTVDGRVTELKNPDTLWSGLKSVTSGLKVQCAKSYENYNFICFSVRSSSTDVGTGVAARVGIQGGSGYINTVVVGSDGKTYALEFTWYVDNQVEFRSTKDVTLLGIYGCC